MKPVSSLENKRMVVPATGEAGETLLEAAVRGKLNKRFSYLAVGIRHFEIVEKMGFNPRLTCWCGEDLELKYFTLADKAVVRSSLILSFDDMTAKLNNFLDEHENCEVKAADIDDNSH